MVVRGVFVILNTKNLLMMSSRKSRKKCFDSAKQMKSTLCWETKRRENEKYCTDRAAKKNPSWENFLKRMKSIYHTDGTPCERGRKRWDE